MGHWKIEYWKDDKSDLTEADIQEIFEQVKNGYDEGELIDQYVDEKMEAQADLKRKYDLDDPDGSKQENFKN